jgi:hypothetical protein
VNQQRKSINFLKPIRRENMSQRVRPIADDSTGGWGTTPLYSKLNELPASDAEYVSAAPADSAAFEVKLGSLVGPPWGAGPRKLTVRLRRTTGDPVAVLVQLLQGSTVIANSVATPSSSFADHEMTLTDSQAAAITNPADLHVRVVAACGTGVDEDCGELDDRLVGFITNKTGSAVDLPDSILFERDPEIRWSSVFPHPCFPTTQTLWLQCTEEDGWQIIGPGSGFFIISSAQFVDLDQQILVFDCEWDDGLGCAGSFQLTITREP